ncbi:hypothetical protein HK098_003433 [Nowakowskiella sp. JEL0407]|nr:hypothetical protein HK098_003433 [Nowakowskiella sp. JEL0407]
MSKYNTVKYLLLIIKNIDTGVITFPNPPAIFQTYLATCLELLHELLPLPPLQISPSIPQLVHPEIQIQIPTSTHIPDSDNLPNHPLIHRSALSHWPAIKLWSNPQYLYSNIGYRYVPIEIGAKYTDDEWTQKIELFPVFWRTCFNSNSPTSASKSPKRYLAQYNLFQQFPELAESTPLPFYFPPSVIHVWIGPENTISPIHFDDKNNFFVQVVGYKYFIIVEPKDNVHDLVKGGQGIGGNTGWLDFEDDSTSCTDNNDLDISYKTDESGVWSEDGESRKKLKVSGWRNELRGL